ncbi:MAG: hypothetical protein JWO03_1829 [Bacteroidetes bacterium]|nr:hypothetical protein [Bacteroidota bacterium]
MRFCLFNKMDDNNNDYSLIFRWDYRKMEDFTGEKHSSQC